MAAAAGDGGDRQCLEMLLVGTGVMLAACACARAAVKLSLPSVYTLYHSQWPIGNGCHEHSYAV
jgi:hypothetical protein